MKDSKDDLNELVFPAESGNASALGDPLTLPNLRRRGFAKGGNIGIKVGVVKRRAVASDIFCLIENLNVHDQRVCWPGMLSG